MFKSTSIIAFLLLLSPVCATHSWLRKKREITLTLQITNLSVRQPFGPFFFMSHNSAVTPLYTFGAQASDELADLAETGSPMRLVDLYNTTDDGSILDIGAFDAGVPYVGGETVMIQVKVDRFRPYVTIASMAINTNDCFAAINGMRLKRGHVLYLPGLDAGSEENNELCASIPGPACASVEGNVASGNGEGFVHVHPGFFGLGDLPDGRYDWRNPMVEVKVM